MKYMNILSEFASGKHAHEIYTPSYMYPILCGETGINRSIPIISFFLIQNIDCGYALEPPQAVQKCTHNQCFEQRYKNNYFFFPLEFLIFAAEKLSVYCMGKFSLWLYPNKN